MVNCKKCGGQDFKVPVGSKDLAPYCADCRQTVKPPQEERIRSDMSTVAYRVCHSPRTVSVGTLAAIAVPV